MTRGVSISVYSRRDSRVAKQRHFAGQNPTATVSVQSEMDTWSKLEDKLIKVLLCPLLPCFISRDD